MSYLQNVALLVKDELVFEVKARGGSAVGDVMALRSQLRELVVAGVEADWPECLIASNELSICKRKVEEWEGLLDDTGAEPPVGRDRSRLLARLGHLIARLRILNRAPTLEPSDRTWVLESLGTLDQVQMALVGSVTPVAAGAGPFFEDRPSVAGGAVPAGGLVALVEAPAVPEVSSGEVVGRVVSAVGAGVLPVASSGGGLGYSVFGKLPNPFAPLLQSPCHRWT